MQCPKCGALLNDNARFCAKCGCNLAQARSSDSAQGGYGQKQSPQPGFGQQGQTRVFGRQQGQTQGYGQQQTRPQAFGQQGQTQGYGQQQTRPQAFGQQGQTQGYGQQQAQRPIQQPIQRTGSAQQLGGGLQGGRSSSLAPAPSPPQYGPLLTPATTIVGGDITRWVFVALRALVLLAITFCPALSLSVFGQLSLPRAAFILVTGKFGLMNADPALQGNMLFDVSSLGNASVYEMYSMSSAGAKDPVGADVITVLIAVGVVFLALWLASVVFLVVDIVREVRGGAGSIVGLALSAATSLALLLLVLVIIPAGINSAMQEAGAYGDMIAGYIGADNMAQFVGWGIWVTLVLSVGSGIGHFVLKRR